MSKRSKRKKRREHVEIVVTPMTPEECVKRFLRGQVIQINGQDAYKHDGDRLRPIDNAFPELSDIDRWMDPKERS